MRNWLPNPNLFNWRRSLFVLFAATVLIRVVFILTLQDGFYFADSWRYTGAANSLIEHGEFPESYDRAPLYPLFLASVYSVAGNDIFYTRIVQAFLGGIIAVLIALIGRQIGGRSVGIFAGFLWAIYPMGAFISGLIYPTTLLTILMAGGALCLVTRPDDSGYATRVGFAGLLFGLGVLAKPVVLASIVFVTFWILLRRRPGSVLLAGIFILAFATALLPWVLRSVYVHDRLVPIESRSLESVAPWASKKTDKAKQIVKQEIPGKAEAPSTSQEVKKRSPSINATTNKADVWAQVQRMAERFPREFINFFELYPRRVGYLKQEKRDKALKHNPRLVRYTPFGSNLVMTVSVISVGSLYVLALVGIVGMCRDKNKRRQLGLLVLLVLSFALGYAVTWGKIRYRVPVDPYIIILSGWGLVVIRDALASKLGYQTKSV